MVRLFLIFIISFSYLFSNEFIGFDSFTINKGEKKIIPILSNLAFKNNTSQITVNILYNSKGISIDKVISNSNLAFKCNDFKLNHISFSKLDSAISSFSCNNLNYNYKDTLFYLEISGLGGSDSLSYIKFELYFDNNKYQIDNLNNIIKITDILTFIGFDEFIGFNYPNPFSYSTTFPIAIDKTNKIKFSIFSINGQEIINSISHTNFFVLLKKENSNWIKLNLNENLDKGFYKLIFYPNEWEFAPGAYYLIIETSNKLLYRNFMVVR